MIMHIDTCLWPVHKLKHYMEYSGCDAMKRPQLNNYFVRLKHEKVICLPQGINPVTVDHLKHEK